MNSSNFVTSSTFQRSDLDLMLSEPYPKWLLVLDAILLLTISLWGICGNLMVFLAFCLSNKVRTRTNLFVVNLALADFLTCTTIPVVAWSFLITTREDVGPVDFPCNVTIFLGQCFIGCSVVTLALVALSRWVRITRIRGLYNKVYTSKRILGMLCVSWLYPFFVAITPLLFGIGRIGYDDWSHNCALLEEHPHSYLYKMILLSCLVPIPGGVIIYSYWGLFKHIKVHNTKVSRTRSDALGPTSSEDLRRINREQVEGNNLTRTVSQHQIDITMNLFLVVLTFIVCISPYMFAEFFKASAVVVNHTKILVCLNSCLNPILYALKHPHFSQVFKCIVLCRWGKIPQPTFY